jgi:hypothetical protein
MYSLHPEEVATMPAAVAGMFAEGRRLVGQLLDVARGYESAVDWHPAATPTKALACRRAAAQLDAGLDDLAGAYRLSAGSGK